MVFEGPIAESLEYVKGHTKSCQGGSSEICPTHSKEKKNGKMLLVDNSTNHERIIPELFSKCTLLS
jgi:hypothetical protein